ncbi:protein-L-isoaspartate O-methyltransferase [Arsenicicoccus piscis]|uniref:protein-L-isoaspartate O-methyltransferase family protein n=1 Tax=Arsenicicoccus piscis TaxID=673954 RepID=UPI001F4CDFB7|nr:protein-L-isoaspartate O-methyltransferase [Arsenicicoccus piscis]MCH8627159.1 protein-L-isoaspartate O-methyltransferase [Arsenicicoccus piscis]
MDDSVRAAFAACPRDHYLPEGEHRRSGMDQALPTLAGSTCSQPSTVADMLGLLGVAPGQHVLDIGSGSGWTTAMLAHMTGPQGSVLGLEIDEQVMEFGRDNLARGEFPWATIRLANPVVLGAPEDGPFDRILVSAMARRVPHPLVDQLAEGGVMVVPVAGVMLRIARSADGVDTTEHGFYRFVPLR